MAKTKEQPMFGYKVPVSSQSYESWCNSDEEFASWGESSDWNLGGTATPEKKYPDVVCPHDFAPGDTAYLVWVVYSTGDSFGHHSGGGHELVGLFRDRDTAEKLAADIEANAWAYNRRGGSRDAGYHFVTPDGQEFKSGYAPWKGYFESLDNARVDSVVIR